MAVLYGCAKFGLTLGLIGFFSLCGFLAVPVVMSAVGWTLVVLVMRWNWRR